MVTLADRRQFHRNQIDWPVSVYVPRLAMFVNGRSVDVSQTGAKVSLPLSVPLQPGQLVELNFPRTSTLAKLAGSFSRIKTAMVVRIEDDSPKSDDAPALSLFSAPGNSDGSFESLMQAQTAVSIAKPQSAVAKSRKTSRPRRQYVAVRFAKDALSA
jgi:hypothetical protein